MNKTKTANRSWGLDLLRILAMMGIVCLHVYNKGGALAAADGSLPKMLISRIIFIASYCSVNIFGMLTGWLYVGRESVKKRSLVRLLITMLGWSAAITASAVAYRPGAFVGEPILLLHGLFPPFAYEYWYMMCYALCFLMIPYMNAMIRALKQEQYRKLLITLFLLLSVVSTLGLKDYFRINAGYDPLWLMFCYLLGGYMRLYPSDFRKLTTGTALAAFLGNVLLVAAADLVGTKLNISSRILLYNYNSPFTVANAVFLLTVFSKLTVRGEFARKIVLRLSGSAFSVYIIHTHPLIFHYPLQDMFAWTTSGGLLLSVVGPIAGTVGIYIACSAASLLVSTVGTIAKKLFGGAR